MRYNVADCQLRWRVLSVRATSVVQRVTQAEIVLFRGVIGELDEELDQNLDLSALRAHPLKPVQH